MTQRVDDNDMVGGVPFSEIIQTVDWLSDLLDRDGLLNPGDSLYQRAKHIDELRKVLTFVQSLRTDGIEPYRRRA